MPSIRPTKGTFTVLMIVAGLILALNVFTYVNRTAKLRELGTELSSRRQKLEDGKLIAKRLRETEARYLEIRSELGVLEQRVSTKAYVPTLLKQLEDLGRSVNLRVVGVRPKPAQQTAPRSSSAEGSEKKPEPYDKLDIDIEVAGRYWDVLRFIQDITTFPKIVAVREVQLAPRNNGAEATSTESPELSVKLATTAFILKDNPLQSDTPQPDTTDGTSVKTVQTSKQAVLDS